MMESKILIPLTVFVGNMMADGKSWLPNNNPLCGSSIKKVTDFTQILNWIYKMNNWEMRVSGVLFFIDVFVKKGKIISTLNRQILLMNIHQ